ncbi:MAG: hypothetical protein R8M37_00320 [Alphaproteobacteria bacterium]|nr:hypothetical protein [Alphaproteobacteria bacterium]
MKKELKISTLSIACVLCTAMAAPAFGAASVRSLGGVGTYNGTSSAASAKSSAGSSAINAVRGGAMRVNSTGKTAGTRVSSTRSATTPRLSIGKYLAGSSALGSSSITQSGGNNKPGSGSGDTGDLQTRIEVLEQFTDYTPNGPTIPEQFKGVELKVEELAADLSAISGVHTTVDYADGKLTVVQDGVSAEYDLANDFAAKSAIDALQSAIDDVVANIPTKLSELENDTGFITAADIPDVTGFVSTANLEAAKAELKALIETKQAIGDYAKRSDLEDLQTQLADVLASDIVTAGQITDLQADVAVLQSTANDYATKTALGNLEAALNDAIADTVSETEMAALKAELEQKIAAVTGGVDLSGLSASVAQNASDIAAVKTTADSASNMANENATDIIALQGLVGDESVATQIANSLDVADYATNARVDQVELKIPTGLADVAFTGSYDDLSDTPDMATYATHTQVSNVVETALNSYTIPDGSVTTAKLADKSVTVAKLNTGNMTDGEMAMLVSNGDGTGEWVTVMVVDDPSQVTE